MARLPYFCQYARCLGGSFSTVASCTLWANSLMAHDQVSLSFLLWCRQRFTPTSALGITHVCVNWQEVRRLSLSYAFRFEGRPHDGFSDRILAMRVRHRNSNLGVCGADRSEAIRGQLERFIVGPPEAYVRAGPQESLGHSAGQHASSTRDDGGLSPKAEHFFEVAHVRTHSVWYMPGRSVRS